MPRHPQPHHLRICFIDQQGDEAGGAENSLELLLTHLPETVEPSAVLFSDGKFADKLREHGIPVSIFGLPADFIATTRESPSINAAFGLPRACWELATFLRRGDFDIVHTNTIKAHLVGGGAGLISGKPVVHHFRDILHEPSRTLVSAVAFFASRNRIAISTRVADSYGLANTSVIANPVALESYESLPQKSAARAALGLPTDIPIAAVVGRINRWKGQDRFIRAAAAVNSTVAGHFVIVGSTRFRDADYLPELHTLVDTLGMRERVTFIDWLDDPRALYASIDVNVNCSTEEPFGRTVIEAAAAGVPTVCFDDSGVAEFMHEGISGIVVPAHDETALTEGLLAYFGSERRRTEASVAARSWSRQFDSARHARAVVAILQRSKG